MAGRGDVITVLLFVEGKVAIDGRGIFAMGGNQKGGFCKNAFQCLQVIHQQVACGGSHKHFDAASGASVYVTDFVDVVLGCA